MRSAYYPVPAAASQAVRRTGLLTKNDLDGALSADGGAWIDGISRAEQVKHSRLVD